MLIFFDTEYTGLGQRWPRLISLGLVPADGRVSFYAELPPASYSEKCAPWVRENVLPLLEGGDHIMQPDELRDQLLAWFASQPRSIQIACDSETDFNFLKTILAECWPENLGKNYFDLRGMVDTTIYDQAAQHHYSEGNPPHHALADAEAHRKGWLAWADANKNGKH